MKSKNCQKNSEKRDKSNFLPLLTSGQVSALFYAPIKEWKAWNTRMTLLWTILDVIFEMWGNCQFLRLNLHISLYRLFIAFIQYILSSEWSWNSHCSNRSDNEIPTTAALAAVLIMSWSGHVDKQDWSNYYVARRRQQLRRATRPL